jgi:NADPH-dependent 2,4-dienoyl-CoA reductase/sulfur reductase-like enzyme
VAERLVVIGGDAGGMSAAAQVRRLRSDIDIVALERSPWSSYSACGIPYLIGGSIAELDDLVVRTPAEFRDKYRIDVRVKHDVRAIDVDARKVEVRDTVRERTLQVPFDTLLVATGSRPARPEVPGGDSDEVHAVQTLDDAAHLLRHVETIECRRVVVVGGGYIGLEIAEAFLERGAQVTVLEAAPQLMRTLDPDMAGLVVDAMRRHGIDVRLEVEVTAFEPGVVHTTGGEVPADLVVSGMGVWPNSDVAAAAGIATGVRGAIAVDRRQRTNVDGVYAAGDCATSFHRVSQRDVHVALGTVANRHGRVAGINIAGGYATFPGVLGTAVTKICSTEIGRTGLNAEECRRAGLEAVSATIEATNRAGYLPDARPLKVKVTAERGTGRLLGAQIVGEEQAAKRIDVFATALGAGLDVYELSDMDLSYAPPFGPLWDAVLVGARRAAAAVDEDRTATR